MPRNSPRQAAPLVRATATTPRWVIFTSLAVCLLGLVDAAYLTFEHYTSSRTLACSDTGTINCVKVTTSSYSKVAGVPVALMGLLFFVALTALCLPMAWRSGNRNVRRLRLAGATAGMITVLYLVWVELFKVDAICLWCTAVHGLTFVLFALVVMDAAGIFAAE